MAAKNQNGEFTLESPLKDYEFDENLKTLTMPEYLLERIRPRGGSKNRRSDYIVHGLTCESKDFTTFDKETRKFASAMYKRGMRKLDTVIYMCLDMMNIYPFFVGVWRANGLLRAIYADESEETVISKVKESEVRWILCDPVTAEKCLSVAKKINWNVEVIVTEKYDGCTALASLLEDDGTEMPDLQITTDDLAIIFCTSGTTGNSKGSANTHQNLLYLVEVIARFFPLTDEKPNFIMSKPTHAGTAFALATLAAGKTLLVDNLPTRTTESTFQVIQNHKPGMLWCFAPVVLEFLNHPNFGKYDLGSIEVICSGGGPLPALLENQIPQLPNLTVANVYGLTELGIFTLCLNFENGTMEKYPNSPPSSVGKLFPGVSLQIREIDSRAILGPNQTGELCVKSKLAFNGYYKDDKATTDAHENEWFKSGDVGYYDENGFLFVTDRIKDMFKYSQNHISPRDIEDVISQHPDVWECCVIGLLQPDGWQSLPRAFVSLKHGSSTSADDISNFANDRLADYKRLRGGLFILPELPKGKTGKIQRLILNELHPS